MRETLAAFLPVLQRHEGGYVDHPSDPGGCTNLGITLRTLRDYMPNASCHDVRRLSWDLAAFIYQDSYWGAVHGDDLPPGVDAVVFDHAVNAGPIRAIKLLQKVLGVEQDGMIGSITLGHALLSDHADLVRKLSAARLGYYERLRTWKIFGKGWSRRVGETRKWALDRIALKEATYG